MRYLLFIAVTLVLTVTSCTTTPPPKTSYHKGDTFSFALIGDTPYDLSSKDASSPFDKMVNNINNDFGVKWVLHAGDIKSGSSVCSEEIFTDRKQRFNEFSKPVILTPGDNEWTDCHRVSAGQYQPLERLKVLREVFFSTPGESLGRQVKQLQSQANKIGYEEFPENTMWIEKDIVFAAIHLVGSQNGLRPFDKDSVVRRTRADDEEVARRVQAALAWLDTIFYKASQIGAPGVFILTHANPGLVGKNADRTGFESFHRSLEEKVKKFKRPVVLAHGDTHYFRIDKPGLGGSKFLANFTRVETFGAPNVHWVRVIVDPASDTVFSFQQHIVPVNK